MIRLSGRYRSALIIGLQGIRARKTRTLLSMVSLFLGVLAVVTVQAGAEIGKRALLSDPELTRGKDGTTYVNMPPQGTLVPDVMALMRGRSDAVALTTGTATIGEPDVMAVNPGGAPFDVIENGGGGYGPYGPPSGVHVVCDQSGCYKFDAGSEEAPEQPVKGAAIDLMLAALSGDIRQFRPFRLAAGQWLDFTGEPSYSPRLVINQEAAKFFNRFVVPAEMRMENASANATPRIIGVVDDGQHQPMAYVRADEVANWAAPGAEAGDVPFRGGLEVFLTPDAFEAEQLLRAKVAASGLPADAVVFEVINSQEDLDRELKLMRWIFLGLASLVLLIGVAGILNVGLATVGERIEEFALRRAVGTPRLLLAGIVLAETLLTGLLTAAAAIGAGIVGLEMLSRLFGDREAFLQDVAFPWQAGVAGIVAGLVAGLLGGFVPALRAARIPIATVMRA